MNVGHLRYAQAVARERSFSAAARTCSVTQPALSNGIAGLERMLGGRLFDRTRRGVTPTPLGERVLPLIERTLRALDTVLAEAKLATSEEPRPLRIGVTSLINRDLIGRAFEVAREIVPDHDIVLRATSLAELRTGLAEAALDLMLVPAVDPTPDFQRATIGAEPMMYIGPWPSRTTAPIELREIARATLILPTDACGLRPFTHQLFAGSGLSLSTYAEEAHDCRVIQNWVALGFGSAMLPLSKVNSGVVGRPVHVALRPVTISYELCWLATSPLGTELAGIAEVLTSPVDRYVDRPRLVVAG